MNGTHYKRYDVIEEYDICEGCGAYKNVFVDILGHNIFGNTVRLFKRLFPKPEPEEVIIEWLHEKDPDEPEAEEIEKVKAEIVGIFVDDGEIIDVEYEEVNKK